VSMRDKHAESRVRQYFSYSAFELDRFFFRHKTPCSVMLVRGERNEATPVETGVASFVSHSGCECAQRTFVTFSAAGPFWPCTTSNSTFSPSARDLNPVPLMAE
jgi:hypothetical protein